MDGEGGRRRVYPTEKPASLEIHDLPKDVNLSRVSIVAFRRPNNGRANGTAGEQIGKSSPVGGFCLACSVGPIPIHALSLITATVK